MLPSPVLLQMILEHSFLKGHELFPECGWEERIRRAALVRSQSFHDGGIHMVQDNRMVSLYIMYISVHMHTCFWAEGKGENPKALKRTMDSESEDHMLPV